MEKFKKRLVLGILPGLVLIMGLMTIFPVDKKSFASQWESTVNVRLYGESSDTVLVFLQDKSKVVITNTLSFPAFTVAVSDELELCRLTTGVYDGLSVLVLLKPVDVQKVLVLVKSQVEPRYVTETFQRPKKTWVEGYQRQGAYVKPYRRKDGTYVKGYYKKGGSVKGHWRTVGTETITNTVKKYPYSLTSERLNMLIFSILNSKYATELPAEEIASQIASLKNSLKSLETSNWSGFEHRPK